MTRACTVCGLLCGFRPPPQSSVDTAVKPLNGATDLGASLCLALPSGGVKKGGADSAHGVSGATNPPVEQRSEKWISAIYVTEKAG